MRTVPYIIWSNYLEFLSTENDNICSMTDIMPKTLSKAKMPLSAFYANILKMQEVLPVRTSYGVVQATDGSIETIDGSDYESLVNQYYYLEYYSLTGKQQKKKMIFEPGSS